MKILSAWPCHEVPCLDTSSYGVTTLSTNCASALSPPGHTGLWWRLLVAVSTHIRLHALRHLGLYNVKFGQISLPGNTAAHRNQWLNTGIQWYWCKHMLAYRCIPLDADSLCPELHVGIPSTAIDIGHCMQHLWLPGEEICPYCMLYGPKCLYALRLYADLIHCCHHQETCHEMHAMQPLLVYR